MRFWGFLYCFVLADDILSFWVYVEKYLEFFTSLSWCVCLQLNVIFSTNMWTMLTELFHASVCWAVKKREVLRAASFRTWFLSISASALCQRIAMWWKPGKIPCETRKPVFLQMLILHSHYVHKTEDLGREFPSCPVLLLCPPTTRWCQQVPTAHSY